MFWFLKPGSTFLFLVPGSALSTLFRSQYQDPGSFKKNRWINLDQNFKDPDHHEMDPEYFDVEKLSNNV